MNIVKCCKHLNAAFDGKVFFTLKDGVDFRQYRTIFIGVKNEVGMTISCGKIVFQWQRFSHMKEYGCGFDFVDQVAIIKEIRAYADAEEKRGRVRLPIGRGKPEQ